MLAQAQVAALVVALTPQRRCQVTTWVRHEVDPRASMRHTSVRRLTVGPPTIDHLITYATDFEVTQRFHDAVLAALGYRHNFDMVTAAGLAPGAIDHGAPGERPHYHPGYYGAFLLDPDGNNVEAVHHG